MVVHVVVLCGVLLVMRAPLAGAQQRSVGSALGPVAAANADADHGGACTNPPVQLHAENPLAQAGFNTFGMWTLLQSVYKVCYAAGMKFTMNALGRDVCAHGFCHVPTLKPRGGASCVCVSLWHAVVGYSGTGQYIVERQH